MYVSKKGNWVFIEQDNKLYKLPNKFKSIFTLSNKLYINYRENTSYLNYPCEDEIQHLGSLKDYNYIRSIQWITYTLLKVECDVYTKIVDLSFLLNKDYFKYDLHDVKVVNYILCWGNGWVNDIYDGFDIEPSYIVDSPTYEEVKQANLI